MINWIIALAFAVATPQAAPVLEQTVKPPQPADQTTTYKVGPQDIIKVEVFGEKELSGVYRIDNDGTINFPLLERVKVNGLTTQEIVQLLKTKLVPDYLNNPQINVDVDAFHSRFIFIAGEVRNPGKYPLKGDVTLLEMVLLAGSVTTDASDEVLVIRPPEGARDAAVTPDNSAAYVLTRMNLGDLKTGKLAGNVLLDNGDTIFIPPAERFYVSGHIGKPASYVWRRGLTVEQALAIAGGVTERGSTRRLRVRRQIGPNPTNTKEIDIKMTDIVQPNDTIIVRQRLI
jgi:polysaccharide biosynthesis/export protein